MQFIEYIFFYRLVKEAFFIRQKKKTHHCYEVWQLLNHLPREWKRIGLGYTYFSMIQLVALSWWTDPIVLLCNRKDLIYIWVFKPLDCSSPKSMWFLWNIFSKGTHMLQCLCGKSLKKNKNPSGKLITIMPTSPFRCEPALCVHESVRRCVCVCAWFCVIRLFVVRVIDLQSHLCSKWIMRRHWEGENLLCAATIGVLGFRDSAPTHKKPPCITTAPWSPNFLNSSHTEAHTQTRARIHTETRTGCFLFLFYAVAQIHVQLFCPVWCLVTRLFHPRVDCSSIPPSATPLLD